MLRCSAAQKGLFGTTARCRAGVCDRRKNKPSRVKGWMDFLVADYTCLFSKGSVCAESPFRTAEQRSNRRGSPAQLSEWAQPASSAPAACCEQRKAVGLSSVA